MKILFDHQAFQQIIGGVSRYYVETIKHLNEGIEREVAVRYSRNLYIKEILPGIKYPFGNFYIPFKRRIIRQQNLNYAISRLKNSTYDIFHATFDDSYFLPYLKTPFVISVHDLIPESEPDKWPTGWLECRKQVFLKANHIICPSNFTKKELLQFYPNLDISKISVIYHGYEQKVSIKANRKSKNYIIFIGGRKGYKNFERFVKACAPLLHENMDLKLFCTGEKFTKEEVQLLAKLKIWNKVIQKKVSDVELRNLYKNALLFVFPSLKEGFGIPILEAWGNGCPVALSDTGPFPEIAGDAAEYFDPMDEGDIQNCIRNILSDKGLRNNLIRKGENRLKLFSWEHSSLEHERIYHQTLLASK